MEPAQLTLRHLRDMTNNFSKGQEIGKGGFGTVYRGEDENGEYVAVKVIRNDVPERDDKDFKNELDNLRKINHPNIVKLIGYCYVTKHIYMEHNGKAIFAENPYRALCFEYLEHGSLRSFLSGAEGEQMICDGPLAWCTRFKIIKGVCEGLKHLHKGLKNCILHLDLKPENILLHTTMVPKLADFGFSEIFDQEQTRKTMVIKGTHGYMPPEYVFGGEISEKFDIYSLGIVMIEIISGKVGRSKSGEVFAKEFGDPKNAEMVAQEFIDLVHSSWKVKLQEECSASMLEVYCQQVKKCTEIALKCIKFDKYKRPKILDIVRDLNGLETMDEKDAPAEKVSEKQPRKEAVGNSKKPEAESKKEVKPSVEARKDGGESKQVTRLKAKANELAKEVVAPAAAKEAAGNDSEVEIKRSKSKKPEDFSERTLSAPLLAAPKHNYEEYVDYPRQPALNNHMAPPRQSYSMKKPLPQQASDESYFYMPPPHSAAPEPYFLHSPPGSPARPLQDPYDMFNEENPHACSVM